MPNTNSGWVDTNNRSITITGTSASSSTYSSALSNWIYDNATRVYEPIVWPEIFPGYKRTNTQYLSFASGEMLPIVLGSRDSYISSGSEIDDILWGIDNNIVATTFRIYVLYPDDSINYEIPGDYIKSGGSYQENYQNGARRTLSFTLYNFEGDYTPNINQLWAGTRLRLDVGIQTNTDTIYWVKKGIYVISDVSTNVNSANREVQVSAADKFSILEGSTGKIEATYEIPAGTLVEEAIKDILHMSMGNGEVFDRSSILYSRAFVGKKTGATITKNAGDTYGSLLLDLATQLSAEMFYNANGNLVVVPIQETTLDGNKPLLCCYNTNDGNISDFSLKFDYSAIINRIIVIGTTTSGGTFVTEAVNDDASSPLCYTRIGYRTGDIINDSNIYSQELARDRAEYELRQQLVLKSSTNAEVIFNPILAVNNLIAISDEFLELDKERFLLQSISFSLDSSNKMSISFSNLRNLPFVTK